MPGILREILASRGIESEADIAEFISPKPQLAYDPFLLTNMRAGVDLLLKYIDEGRSIVIYGDYDVDGVTATAVLMKTLGCLTDNLTYYIPSRLDEGYGLNREAIDRIKEAGGELIVTVDCGAVSRDETKYAHELGIETLVTDHHNAIDVIAEGIVIDPKAKGDEYPFKGLAGVGVAYKLALAVGRERNIPRSLLNEVLELVAIGTIADIMPLVDENRTIVKYGLRLINSGCRNRGLRRLIELAGLNAKTLKATNISFGIAPRINAAGRLGDATLGVKMFLSEDDAEVERYCQALMDANNRRKSLQESAYDSCIKLAREESKESDFILIEAKDAHEGILGIVAGRIKEELERPTIIVSRNGDEYKGTGRSTEKVDLYSLLAKHRECFMRFGGHSSACGFTISEENLQPLKDYLRDDVAELLADDETLFDVETVCDATIGIEEARLDLASSLELLEPCGMGNEAPVFRIPGVVPQDFRFLKGDNKYAKFSLDSGEGYVDFMIFRDAFKYEGICTDGREVDVYGTINVNTWNGRDRVRVVVTDILRNDG